MARRYRGGDCVLTSSFSSSRPLSAQEVESSVQAWANLLMTAGSAAEDSAAMEAWDVVGGPSSKREGEGTMSAPINIQVSSVASVVRWIQRMVKKRKLVSQMQVTTRRGLIVLGNHRGDLQGAQKPVQGCCGGEGSAYLAAQRQSRSGGSTAGEHAPGPWTGHPQRPGKLWGKRGGPQGRRRQQSWRKILLSCQQQGPYNPENALSLGNWVKVLKAGRGGGGGA